MTACSNRSADGKSIEAASAAWYTHYDREQCGRMLAVNYQLRSKNDGRSSASPEVLSDRSSAAKHR